LNSLKDEVSDLETKLVEIRLSIKHPQNKGKVFILLEGNNDIKLFRKIFSNKYTDTSALNGKDKVVKALQTLHVEKFTQVIGIKDADFEHLESSPDINNLFITDFHDMEIEMIESDALNSIINEFSSGECHEFLLDNLKNNIYDIALEIGYARWYNENEKIKNGDHVLRFKGLDFNNFIDIEKCQISFKMDNFLNSLLQHSNNISTSNSELKEEVNKLKVLSQNKLQISNGHDLTKLISMLFSISDNSDKSNINKDKIEESLRLSYSIEYFKNTKLFNSLDDWADSNNHRLFISNKS